MSRLSPVSWKKFDTFLRQEGCKLTRTKGDHLIYHKKGLRRPVVIPKEKHLPIFIIKNNLRILNISIDNYINKIQNL